MEDKQIIDLYWERSETAITETDKKYGRYCHYIVYQILSDDECAKEVVNDTYLKAWNTIPPKRPDPLKPYLGMLSRQLALNKYEEIMNLLIENCLIKDSTVVIWEVKKGTKMQERFGDLVLYKEKNYGISSLFYYHIDK